LTAIVLGKPNSYVGTATHIIFVGRDTKENVSVKHKCFKAKNHQKVI